MRFATRINSFSQKVVHRSRDNKAGSGSKPHTADAAIIYNHPEIDAGPWLPDSYSREIAEETIEFLHPAEVLGPCSEPPLSPEAETPSDASSLQSDAKPLSSTRTSRTTAFASDSAAELVETACSNEQEQCLTNASDLENLRVFVNTLPFPTTYTACAGLTQDSGETNSNHSSPDNSREEIFANVLGAVNRKALQVVALAVRRSRLRNSHRFVRLPKTLTCTVSPETVPGT